MDHAGACKSLQAAVRLSRRTHGCANSGDEGGRMSLFRRGEVRWYEFWFAGRRIQESSKSLWLAKIPSVTGLLYWLWCE
jgi:hypothetical protein